MIASAMVILGGSPKMNLYSGVFFRFCHLQRHPVLFSLVTSTVGVVLNVQAHVAAGYARAGNLVTMDGDLAPSDSLKRSGSSTSPFNTERFRMRGGDALSDPEHIIALHHPFSTLGSIERHVRPTVNNGRKTLLSRVDTVFDSGSYSLSQSRLCSAVTRTIVPPPHHL